jgi:hypothetical protein
MRFKNNIRVLLFVGTLCLMSGCNEVEFNNPAFQADLNNQLWRASSFRAIYNDAGALVITGTNNVETVILTLETDELGSIELSPSSNSRAEFMDGSGQVFSTAVFPDESVSVYTDLGVVNITSRSDGSTTTFTGDFFFVAYDQEGFNPVGLSNGVFFEVRLKED